MKLFKKDAESSKAATRAYETTVNDRMRLVLSRETEHDDAAVVEERLRNMVYGTNRR